MTLSFASAQSHHLFLDSPLHRRLHGSQRFPPLQAFASSAQPESLISSSEPPFHPSSARERRNQRNERREQRKVEMGSWREIVEDRLAEKKKAVPKGLKYELDMSRLTARGMQWWMVLVAGRGEVEMAESITLTLKREFPDNDFEVFVPVVPTKRKMKDGSIAQSTKMLHTGCVFLRTVMSRRVHDIVRKVPRCRGFFGKKVGYLEQVIMPTPVPPEDMEGMFKKIREEEEDFERLKEMAKQEREMMRKTEDADKTDDTPIEVGSTIRITNGPYMNFEGCVSDISDDNEQVEVSISAFGDIQRLVMKSEDVMIVS